MSEKNQKSSEELLDQYNQNQLSQSSDKDQSDESPMVQELKNQLQAQAAQLETLQRQLQQSSDEEQRRDQELRQREAEEEAMRLAEEADLRKALGETGSDRFEQLTNRELIDVMVDAIDKSSDARTKQIEAAVGGTINDVKQQIALTQKAIIKLATAIDVKDVKGQNPELSQYDKEAGEIMQGNPGMSVADAYLLAKARSASKEPPANNTDRERPDSTTTRSEDDRLAEVIERRERQRSSASEERSGRSGVRGVRSIIDAGVDKILSERGLRE